MGPSLDLPRTGKSISIALAFALRACVRACEAAWARDASAVAGVGQMQVPGGPSPRPVPGPAYCFGCGWAWPDVSSMQIAAAATSKCLDVVGSV